MRSHLINDQGIKTYVVIFDVDDPTEVVTGLSDFASEHAIYAAQITAIGMFTHTTLGYFERERKQYRPIVIDENVEVVSLIGDYTLDVEKNQPKLHLHAVVGLSDGSTRGGHLLAAQVGVTLEVIVNVYPATLRRVPNKDVGLALIELNQSET
jgi:predicted DNA-binding protein with PD1-like motif